MTHRQLIKQHWHSVHVWTREHALTFHRRSPWPASFLIHILGVGLTTLKFELGLDFLTVHLSTKFFRHHVFNRSEVIVLTNKQEFCWKHHLASLCYADGKLCRIRLTVQNICRFETLTTLSSVQSNRLHAISKLLDSFQAAFLALSKLLFSLTRCKVLSPVNV